MTQRCQYRSQDSGGGRIVGARAFSVFQVSDTGQQHAACNSSLLGAQGNGKAKATTAACRASKRGSFRMPCMVATLRAPGIALWGVSVGVS